MDESVIRAKCVRGEVDEATTLILKAHGREIMRFLVARTDDCQLASDAFAQFTEDVWRGLPGFELRSSLRSWLFTLAHHALMRLGKARARDQKRLVPAFAASSSFQLAEQMRTETLPFLRSEVREAVARLRRRLPSEDQLLVELRLSQRFSWKDIARITIGSPCDASPELNREAARLRKRFELVKKQLRTWATAEGILSKPE